VGIEAPLPRTHEVAEAPNIDVLEVMAGFQHLARESIDELRNTSRALLER
jgi:hypothetical protein